MKRILVTGAGGQIGSWLVPRLRELYGDDEVLATDVRQSASDAAAAGPFQVLDATNAKAVGQAVIQAAAVPYQASSLKAPAGSAVLPNESHGSFRFRSAARAAAELHQEMSLPT